jgi:recombination protein RecR
VLSKPISNLVEQLQRLPGVGPKSAQRLAYYLLRRPEDEIENLAIALRKIKTDLVTCSQCYNITEENPCIICTDPKRNTSSICVVEEPLDLVAIERTKKYQGVYHVLGGVINPLMGIGPEEIRISELLRRVEESQQPTELILATNPSIEGEATALYISKQIRNTGVADQQVKLTRIARGLPTGGDVEYADQVTLGRALEGRVEF